MELDDEIPEVWWRDRARRRSACRCRGGCPTTPSPRSRSRSGSRADAEGDRVVDEARGPVPALSATAAAPPRSRWPGVGVWRARPGGSRADPPGGRSTGASAAGRALGRDRPERRRQDDPDGHRRGGGPPQRGRRAASWARALGAVDVRELRASHRPRRRRDGRAPSGPARRRRDVVLTGVTARSIVLRARGAGRRPTATAPTELLERMGCARARPTGASPCSRAASSSASCWRAPSSPGRGCCCSTSPPPASTCPAARRSSSASTPSRGRTPGLTTVQVSHHLEELAAVATHALLLRARPRRRRRAPPPRCSTTPPCRAASTPPCA